MKEKSMNEDKKDYFERLYKDAEKENDKLKRQLYLAGFERDEWKKRCNEYLEKYIDAKYD